MMLHMENYCQLILLLLFVVSLVGSLTRSDYNSVYSLLSYAYLATYKGKNSLSETLLNMIIITIVVTLSDIWAIVIQ